MADDDRSPEDEFQELIRQLFGGGASGLDPEQLSRLSGMDIDPAMMQTVMRHLQGAFAGAPDGGISWDLAQRQALHIANQDGLGVTSGQRTDLVPVRDARVEGTSLVERPLPHRDHRADRRVQPFHPLPRRPDELLGRRAPFPNGRRELPQHRRSVSHAPPRGPRSYTPRR